MERGPDLKLIDRLLDERTRVPEFERQPLPDFSPDTRISETVPLPDPLHPFDDEPGLVPKEATIRFGVARSTYRTREPEEVLGALQPFLDLEQRQVNVRPEPVLYEKPDALFYDLLEGKTQLAIAHVFDYLTVRSWMADQQDNGTIILGLARPAHSYMPADEPAQPGFEGMSLLLVVAAKSPLHEISDLRGKRLALAANDIAGPAAFLTQLLRDAAPLPLFSEVRLRRYRKDALIDLLKGRADVACVDEGTLAALDRFYGIGDQFRVIAVSPRYNMDVIFTTVNNVKTHRTEIELTQRQLATLRKDPEGQEILFFFDEAGWQYYKDGDLAVPEQYFADYVAFLDRPPADLKLLLDPATPVDTRTYDRFGDE